MGAKICHLFHSAKFFTAFCHTLSPLHIFFLYYMVKVIFARPLTKDKRTVGEQLENSRTPVGHQLNTSRTPAKEQLGEVSTALVKLIEAIGDNWFSAKELREKMGFKSKSSFIRNYLNPAQNAGIIQLEDAENPQSPNQRYGLTEKCKQILNQSES